MKVLHIGNNGVVSRGPSRSLLLREELDWLMAMMATLPDDARFLEIGTYHGLTAALLAEARPDVTVVSVDLLEKCDNARWQSNRLENMRLFVGTAQQFQEIAAAAELFDGVLIDGDHPYAPCYRDLRTCHALVKANGVRVCHDYGAVP